MSSVGRPDTLPEPWASMALQAGSVAGLALALDTSTMTIWRWAHGEARPRYAMMRHSVNAWARRRNLPAPWPDKK